MSTYSIVVSAAETKLVVLLGSCEGDPDEIVDLSIAGDGQQERRPGDFDTTEAAAAAVSVRHAGFRTLVRARTASSSSVLTKHANLLRPDGTTLRLKLLKPGASLACGMVTEVKTLCYGPVLEVICSRPGVVRVDGMLCSLTRSYRRSGHITTSYGTIICNRDAGVDRVLMVRRVFSIGFSDFVRNRFYNQPDLAQIYVDEMTAHERSLLRCKGFDELWTMLSHRPAQSAAISPGYLQWEAAGNSIAKAGERFGSWDLERMIRQAAPAYDLPEIGFPKGRPNLDEDVADAAIRETREECGLVHGEDYTLVEPHTTVREDFIGSNNITYKMIYFLGICPVAKVMQVPDQNEIVEALWLTKEEALAGLRPYEWTKRGLISEAFDLFRNSSTCSEIDARL